MKKTISINIAGQIFHVEEDAYERLHQYLKEVTRYFSSYEDSKEIISDIESRIAELLNQKLANTRQAVTLEDVAQVISIMGTTSDFAREEDQEDYEQSAPDMGTTTNPPKGKLVRDTQRKLIGGVLSGIAHYFRVDPFWIRLGVLALFFGMFLLPPTPGLVFLAYIILWIVLPANPFLENQKVKKLFRNPEGKAIAGVCSGIAAYFKIDVVPVRLVFVLLIFAGGTGLIAYIIIWAISPQALTIADKLEMEGSPVTLSNIEQTIKMRLQSPLAKEESTLIKVLLFPFRLISSIFTKGAKVLGPIFNFFLQAIRILFGLLLMVLGLSLIAGIVALLLAYFNLWNYGIQLPEYFSLTLIREIISLPLISGAVLTVGIPALALVLLGIWAILAKPYMHKAGVIILSLLWVAGVFLTGFSAVPLANEFRQKAYTETESFHPVDAQRALLLDVATLGAKDRASQSVKVQIRGYEGSALKLVQKNHSMGSTSAQAKVNASYLNLEFQVQDTALLLPQFAFLSPAQPYRGQFAEIFLYIPYNQEFVITESLADQLQNTLNYQGYTQSQVDGKAIWKYDSTGKLLCLACPEKPKVSEALWLEIEEEVNSISAGDRFDLRIKIDEKPSVRIYAKDLNKEDISAEVRGGNLELNMRSSWGWNRESSPEIIVEITTPRLESLKLNGIAKAEIDAYRGETMTLELNGGSAVRFNGSLIRLELNQNGASNCELQGTAEELEASVAGASRLSASEFKTKRVKLETVGASNAEVWADEKLRIESSGVSHVQYQGTASNVEIDEMGVSRVSKRK